MAGARPVPSGGSTLLCTAPISTTCFVKPRLPLPSVQQSSAAGGSRPMLLLQPGLSLSDIALSEIAAEKLSSEPVAVAIIKFPGEKPARKAA